MSGLLDEAVGAMARALFERAGYAWDKWPSLHDHWRETARIGLAALPAGVYISDGKGTVESVDAVERIAATLVAYGMRSDLARSYATLCADLSAMDTEGET